MIRLRNALALFAAALLAACAGNGEHAGVVPQGNVAPVPAGLPVGTYIKHVVIIVQENRTFDNFFAGYPGADGTASGEMSDGTKVALRQISFSGPDLPHGWTSSIQSYDKGKMDGFDVPVTATGGKNPRLPYAYVRHTLLSPYWRMARQYVLADRMFSSELAGSFPGHLDLIASTTNLSPDSAVASDPAGRPWGCDGPAGATVEVVNRQRQLSRGPFPCFDQFKTMADTLDAANVSWKYYVPAPATSIGGKVWLVFDAIKNVRYGPDWTRNIVSPQTRVLADPGKGKLPAVSWVIPDVAYSDHAGQHSDRGPSWVAAVVNAIGKSPDWSSTAIVVVWDDYGGWYDHVPPPQLDFRGLGMRVPCLIISPYAKKGYVSHTQYEFGSILKFVEQAFGLPALGSLHFGSGYTDARANSIVDSFDFTQKPRAFHPIPAKYPPAFFLAMPPSQEPPDNE
jgi:phospholipase C